MAEPINLYLKSLREKSGYTQEEIAKRTNIQRDSIAKYETGQTKGVPIESFLKILKFYYTCTPKSKKLLKLEEIVNLTPSIATTPQKKQIKISVKTTTSPAK